MIATRTGADATPRVADRSVPASASLDRTALVALGLLLALAVAINLDRFALGANGPLRAHDLADQTITAMASCGDFWGSSLQSTWDPTQLRGWPRAGSPMHAQMLMCVTGGIVPIAYIGPIFHTLVLAVIAVGTFLFVRIFLARSYESAVACAALHVALYYFFHEHPIVPSAILLPSLAGFLALPARTMGERAILLTGAVLIIGLSNPPPTLILMPLAHLAIVFVAPAAARKQHLVRWAIFWTAYAVYYGPMMVALLGEFENSSRSLYRPPSVTGDFTGFLQDRLMNPAVISPAAVLLAFVGRRTWRGAVALVLGIVAFVALTAANDVLVQRVGGRFPILVSLSSMYYRMYYLVPVALLVWAAHLFDDLRAAPPQARMRHALLAAGFCVAVAWFAVDPMRVFLPYWKYAAVIAAMTCALPWWSRRTWSVALATALVFAFGRYEFTRIYEVPSQGNLFVERPHYGRSPELLRSVTVMSDCDAVNLFPAQARAAGEDTMDGISNYYSRGYVERWRHFVARNPATCTARYGDWSTRAEVTVADVRSAPDRILAWLWINNVGFVRSPVPIEDPRLTLASEESFTVDRTHQVRRHLYRMDAPVGLVFTLPERVAARAAGPDLFEQERALREIDRDRAVENVDAARRDGSHLRFRGSFGADRVVVANMNFHPGWSVRIDGQPAPTRPRPGPFGMIAVPTVDGDHVYDLEFSSGTTPFVPVFMGLALIVLFMGTTRITWPPP